MPVNHRREANEPERNKPEQPPRTLANATIVVRLQGVEDQQANTQEQPQSLNGLHRRLSLHHSKERDQEDGRQAKDTVVSQEQVEQIEPFRLVGGVNATRS